MTTQGVKRKLTAILSADVKGYSSLMREDEAATVSTLTTYRAAITTLIQKHHGRVVDAPGDNLLAEFASVVDAVQCAVEIQEELKVRNADMPENRKMEFRIGVNLGDVIEEGKRIYGDGVNIAARIEGLAEVGGISLSGTVYEHVKDKLRLKYEYQGEQTVKNIPEPVKVYRVLIDPGAATEVRKEKRTGVSQLQWAALAVVVVLILGAGVLVIWNLKKVSSKSSPVEVMPKAIPELTLPDKPSIAVLPFANLSDDPKQEYFVDGMTDDLITDLSKISGLFVIARNSVFTYKDKSLRVEQIGRELGVRYVLEGSVRKANDKVRINAQLIEATTGHQLWAKRFDGKIDDVFTLQDKITNKIVAALAVKLTLGEKDYIERKETDDIEAYDAFLKGWGHYLRFTPEDFTIAIRHFEKAIELDPNYWRAYAALARTYEEITYVYARPWKLDVSWTVARRRARHYLRMAMKNPTSLAHQVAADMNCFRRQFEDAIAEAEQAMVLDPNDPTCHAVMAWTLIMAGRPEEAVDFLKRGKRLDPLNPARYLLLLGLAKFHMGILEEAVSLFEQARTHNPQIIVGATSIVASAYALLGRVQEARAMIEDRKRMRESSSNYNLRRVMASFPIKNMDFTERFANGLLKAGLPGEPSGYYKIYEENELTGEEIRALVFGRAVAGFMRTGRQWWIVRTREGKAKDIRTSPMAIESISAGKSWIKGDMLCNQWETNSRDLQICAYVFRNPEGTPEIKNEYLTVSDIGIGTLSPQDLVYLKGTDGDRALDAYQRGLENFCLFSPDGLVNASLYFEKAIELDPSYWRAYAALARTYEEITHVYARSWKLDEIWTVVRQRARQYLQTAMKNPTSIAHQVASSMALSMRQYEEAIAEATLAIALDPHDSGSQMAMAKALIYSGKPKEAIDFIKRAMQIDPRNIAFPFAYLGLAHFCMGQFEEAVTFLEKAHDHKSVLWSIEVPLAAVYAHLDRDEEARAAIDVFRRDQALPNVRQVMYFYPFKDMEIADRFADGLLKAGLPGEPSGFYKIYEENKLTGDEIRGLVFGRTIMVPSNLLIKISKNGNATILEEGKGPIETGTISSEGDALCVKWDKLLNGLKNCGPCFRNPEGTQAKKNEYLHISILGIDPFSSAD